MGWRSLEASNESSNLCASITLRHVSTPSWRPVKRPTGSSVACATATRSSHTRSALIRWSPLVEVERRHLTQGDGELEGPLLLAGTLHLDDEIAGRHAELI